MSREIYGCIKEFEKKISHEAEEGKILLKGRILTVTGPNSSYKTALPVSDKNQPYKTIQVPMIAFNVQASGMLELVSESPFSIRLKPEVSTKLPTGIKENNKEIFIPVHYSEVKDRVFSHKATWGTEVTKDLARYFLEV